MKKKGLSSKAIERMRDDAALAVLPIALEELMKVESIEAASRIVSSTLSVLRFIDNAPYREE